MMSRYSRRAPAGMETGRSARVNGAISMPEYPARRIWAQAAAKGRPAKASLHMEWRKTMNPQFTMRFLSARTASADHRTGARSSAKRGQEVLGRTACERRAIFDAGIAYGILRQHGDRAQ